MELKCIRRYYDGKANITYLWIIVLVNPYGRRREGIAILDWTWNELEAGKRTNTETHTQNKYINK